MTEADEEYNKKIKSRGSWIDKSFLEELLSDKLKTAITVQNYNISAAVADGENYLSTLYKTEVTYTVDGFSDPLVTHIMIKGLPESKVTSEVLQQNSTFKKECFFYTSVLPKMRKLIEHFYPLGTPSIAPEEYFTSRADTLVMKDISYEGYKMKIRQEQMDHEHCQHAIRTIARLHALSVKLYQDDPDSLIDACSLLYTDTDRSFMGAFVDEALRALMGEMKIWSIEHEDADVLSEKIGKLWPNLWEQFQELESPVGKFQVFNHGDLWMNNFMFKYDEDGKIHSIKLVDFQLSRYTSPAMDLHYFLCSSVKLEVLNENYFDLIAYYHSEFISDLLTMGVSIDYTLEQLNKDMHAYAPFGIGIVASISAIVLAPTGGGVTEGEELLGDGTSDEHPFTSVYRTESYKTFALNFYRMFDRLGFIDYAVSNLKSAEKESLKSRISSPEPRVASAHHRSILARVKSAANGVMRKFTDIF